MVTTVPNETALLYKKSGCFETIQYHKLKQSVEDVADNLRTSGIGKGDSVGIFSVNRPEWAIADLAILKIGGIVVPIYPTLPPVYVKYIINDSKMKLIFVDNEELYSIIESVRAETPLLSNIILFDDAEIRDGKNYMRFTDRQSAASSVNDKDDEVSGDDIATVVYTSGTTGEPKGVMLTHKNIISNAISAKNRFELTSRDVALSYLPLSHMFERTCGYYAILFSGGSIGYAENLTTMVDDLELVRPTMLLVVPRVLEKAYNKVITQVDEGSSLKKFLVYAAVKNLNNYVNLKYKSIKTSFWLRLKCVFYNSFIASKFIKIGGGKLRILASGGAPLDRRIAKIYHILGFNIIEGYGLTETSPIVSCLSMKDKRFGTVGKPLEDVNVKIGDDKEILVQGPNVMRGYLNKPEETAEAIDPDGWFHTGDQGRFDEDGNLIITGRIKELICTSYGKIIASAPIEAKITRSGYISQVVLCGDNKKYLVALIVPDRESIEHYARKCNMNCDDYVLFLKNEKTIDLISAEVKKATADLPSYERVMKFTLIPDEFTVENGMLTPTLKLKRNKIIEEHNDLIESLYGE